MSNEENEVMRLVARVRALSPEDWQGASGEFFRAMMEKMDQFTRERKTRPKEILEKGIALGRKKLEGLATQEHALSEKNYAEAAQQFAEAEDKKIDSELKKRTLEIRITKEEAEARLAIAEARLAEIKTLEAELELIRKCEEAGVSISIVRGNDLYVATGPKIHIGLPSESVAQKTTNSAGDSTSDYQTSSTPAQQ